MRSCIAGLMLTALNVYRQSNQIPPISPFAAQQSWHEDRPIEKQTVDIANRRRACTAGRCAMTGSMVMGVRGGISSTSFW